MDRSRTIVIETANNRSYKIAGMEPGEIIKQAREKNGWSQKDLGDKVGISQPAIKKIESGDTTHSKFLPRIASVLELDLALLDPTLRGRAEAPSRSYVPMPEIARNSGDLRIYASAEGGEGEIIRSSEPIDFMPRPAPLQHVTDAYGLWITGTSMWPEYKAGDMALVNPHLPVVSGEVYIFYAEQNGEARASIKALRRETPDKWLVSQHNPPEGASKDFSLPKAEWRWAHRVVGKLTRR